MLISIVGTGTGVGKTHVAAALLRQLGGRGERALGWKPVESGVPEGREEGEDERALREACGARCPTVLRLREAVSPHLAARRQRVSIDGAAIAARLGELVAQWPIVVLELAGGWFSPFDESLDNAEWLAALPPSLRAQLALVLVAPDRLGVLHDISAAMRAAQGLSLSPRALALSAPAIGDDASGSNAAELAARRATRELSVVSLPRAPVPALAQHAGMAELATRLLALRS